MVALTEVERLFKSSDTDTELKLLCNIPGVLFFTNLKSYLKSIKGESSQNDVGTLGRDRKRRAAPGVKVVPECKRSLDTSVLRFLSCLAIIGRGAWAQSKEEPFIITVSDWNGLSLEIVAFLDIFLRC